MQIQHALVACVAVSLTLMGCNQADSPEAASLPEAPAASVDSTVVVPDTAGRLHIGSGLALPAGFTHRSSETQGEGGDASHVARYEFDASAAEAANALRRTFVDQGYPQVGATEDGTTLTRIFRSDEGLRLRVTLVPEGPDLKVDLISPQAAGLATFYWREAPVQ